MSHPSDLPGLLQRALDATRRMREAVDRDDLESCERLGEARLKLLEQLPLPLPHPAPADLAGLVRALSDADAELLERVRAVQQALGEQLAALRACRALPYEPAQGTSDLLDQRI